MRKVRLNMKSNSLWSLLFVFYEIDKIYTEEAKHLIKHQVIEINVYLKNELVVPRNEKTSSILIESR